MFQSAIKDLIITTFYAVQIAVEQKVEVGKGIAAGIQYMHHHNPVIIHRDLKPLNIMVCMMDSSYGNNTHTFIHLGDRRLTECLHL